MSSSIPIETNTTSDEKIEKVNNCKLLVNGKDITNGKNVKINYEYQNTELPLLAILKELGADVQWEDNSRVIVTFEKIKVDIDTTKDDFGIPIPPGTSNAIRYIINNELQIDGTSVQGLLLNIFRTTINVDYEAGIIYINSAD